ncbi:MAG: sigma-70 family RNA polymerase sigma factor [Candidatus Doudnabacteria bacterium]
MRFQPTDSDNVVIQAYLAGEKESAFAEIVRRYQPRLIEFLYHRVGFYNGRAEDLTQETFLRVIRHFEAFDLSKKFSTWIYAIATNLAKNEIRNRKRALVIHEGDITLPEGMQNSFIETFPDRRNNALTEMVKQEQRSELRSAIDKLPQAIRLVLNEKIYSGKSEKRIAEEHNINIGTVKSRHSRARKRLMAAYSRK